jgi:hypothetical protein
LKCWKENEERPTTNEILEELEKIIQQISSKVKKYLSDIEMETFISQKELIAIISTHWLQFSLFF